MLNTNNRLEESIALGARVAQNDSFENHPELTRIDNSLDGVRFIFGHLLLHRTHIIYRIVYKITHIYNLTHLHISVQTDININLIFFIPYFQHCLHDFSLHLFP